MAYLIFNQNLFDIPIQDYPEAGDFIVCHDPYRRLAVLTWGVFEVRPQGSPGGSALGVFWRKKMAVLFAEGLVENAIYC